MLAIHNIAHGARGLRANMLRGGLNEPLCAKLCAYQDRLQTRPAWQRAWARSEAAPAQR